MKISEYIRAIGPIPSPDSGSGSSRTAKIPGTGPSDFQKVLEGSINMSNHAQARILSRAIHWDEAIERRVLAGIDAAEQKGSREALILADDLAVIANVKTRTVVTAIERSQMKETIFTNIDSAVLV